MSLVFRENAKNRQNHGVFEGAVIGVNNFPMYFLRETTPKRRFYLQWKNNWTCRKRMSKFEDTAFEYKTEWITEAWMHVLIIKTNW